MKRLIIGAIIIHLSLLGNAGYAQNKAAEILKAVVKVRAVIRDDAVTAPLLGTERDNNPDLTHQRACIGPHRVYTAPSLNVRQLFMYHVPMFLRLGRPAFHK